MNVEKLLMIKEELFAKANDLTVSKGLGYGLEHDTLRNMRFAEYVSVCDAPTAAYIRLLDKVFRLGRLLKNPDIPHDSLEDTVIDLINYATYVYALVEEKRE